MVKAKIAKKQWYPILAPKIFGTTILGESYIYDPEQMVAFLKKLRELEEKEPLKEFSYWRTHPNIPQRIAVANETITGKLEFRDYLNLIGND